ncbi:MAG: hypothetical protein Fur0028_15050 [Bacteroidales bacterium]
MVENSNPNINEDIKLILPLPIWVNANIKLVNTIAPIVYKYSFKKWKRNILKIISSQTPALNESKINTTNSLWVLGK